MLCLSGFELYSRWVRLIIRDQVMTLAQNLPKTAIIISLFKLVCFLYYNIIPSFYTYDGNWRYFCMARTHVTCQAVHFR